MMANAMYSQASRFWGWALAAVFLVHSVIQINMPRTAKTLPLREELRGWHYLVGTILLILVIGRLWTWWKEPRPAPPPGMGAGAWHWGRTLTLASYLTLLVAPVFGLLYGWADGLQIHWGPLPAFPNLMEKNRAIWQFTGYFHSGLGFMMMTLNLAGLLTIAYTLFRYGRGALSALPPGYGVMVLGGLTVTVYAFTTFRSPEPGPRAVLIFWAVLAVGWGLARLLKRRQAAERQSRSPVAPGWVRAISPFAAFGLIVLASMFPWWMFKAQPIAMGEVVEAAEGLHWHETLATKVTVVPETPFEKQVRAETFKWCGFCHSFKKGEEPKLGPNLYGIFGQRAATTPNFHFSPALAKAGREGLIWTDATIAAYIADPQKNIPGTTMIISSGPIPDPRAQAAIVNILKKETMPVEARTGG